LHGALRLLLFELYLGQTVVIDVHVAVVVVVVVVVVVIAIIVAIVVAALLLIEPFGLFQPLQLLLVLFVKVREARPHLIRRLEGCHVEALAIFGKATNSVVANRRNVSGRENKAVQIVTVGARSTPLVLLVSICMFLVGIVRETHVHLVRSREMMKKLTSARGAREK